MNEQDKTPVRLWETGSFAGWFYCLFVGDQRYSLDDGPGTVTQREALGRAKTILAENHPEISVDLDAERWEFGGSL